MENSDEDSKGSGTIHNLCRSHRLNVSSSLALNAPASDHEVYNSLSYRVAFDFAIIPKLLAQDAEAKTQSNELFTSMLGWTALHNQLVDSLVRRCDVQDNARYDSSECGSEASEGSSETEDMATPLGTFPSSGSSDERSDDPHF